MIYGCVFMYYIIVKLINLIGCLALKCFSWISISLLCIYLSPYQVRGSVIFSISDLSIVKQRLTLCVQENWSKTEKLFQRRSIMSVTVVVMIEIKINPRGLRLQCSRLLISQPVLTPGVVCQMWHVWNENMLAADLVIHITAACWNVPRMQGLKQLHTKEIKYIIIKYREMKLST